MLIPIIIPARNEEKRLATTLASIDKMAKFAKVDVAKIVVDDGSKDQTATIAKQLGCIVINLPDRGYSALARPELANTHNAGFEYAQRHFPNSEYLMVIGADSLFEENYLLTLLQNMEKNPNLAIASGVIDSYKTAVNAVRGTGRIIRNSFWEKMGAKVPALYYSWESYPLIYAQANGYETRSFPEAVMHTSRSPLENTDWKRYGIGMKEQGCILPYVLLRALRGIKDKQWKNAIRLIQGFLFSSPELYPEDLRLFVREYQINKMMNFLLPRK